LFGCAVTAIDADDRFIPRGPAVTFRQMDARALNLPADSFDLVYSFHALEHIVPAEDAIREMRRVLKPGMLFCIGTPNRHRLVAYVGSPDTSLFTKLRWNWMDWRARLSGRFTNALGAHAGFTERELSALGALIGPAESVSDDYYRRIYARRARLIGWIIAAGLQAVAWPAAYIAGRKAG
jgi:ubiquinone/menaquinone biosynthesis C-methylase UbiE